MLKPSLPMEEIDHRGQELYDSRLRALVETPENIGRELVLDVLSGDYEIDADGLAASRRLARHPNGALHGIRIGYNAVYALGSTLRLTTAE